ncbi:pyruvate kinase [Borrelia parkeri]|uniref:Pyruvate kinase n=1 Tax=Borrelia parkeri SLO TaxID=1313294 RepID=A0ABN4C6K9_BORPR|nr:pyruvate kinase [Borrelia parkeri]AHE62678.1 pyruvate kinase [Borrelia parkeri HR1]AHH09585.1 Pyruvate kinase [Borrelia parkeri SLO]UPA10517.1 pyruvate kinase [Borrelia parkeri]
MIQKLTKIVATISDLRCDPEHIKELYEAGVNVIRLNTAHQSHDDAIRVINNVRQVSNKIALMIDTKGPEVRTANIENPITVKIGDKIIISTSPINESNALQTNYDGFVNEVPNGSTILIDDGELEMTVIEKLTDRLICKVKNDGQIKNKKSINTPGISLKLQSVTEKDRGFIELAAKQNIDFIAHSFVRHAKDIQDVQDILNAAGNPDVKIIAKVENQEGIDNIEEIAKASYGIMVARGDMGVEIPAEDVPLAQIKITKTCIKYGVPVITATQMLHTMIENPRPTRAEVSDVANAILNGTDAIMLSGETAYGKYPIEAVKMMTKIAIEVEKYREKTLFQDEIFHSKRIIRNYIIKCAIDATKIMPVKAIIVDSLKGRTARIMATYRASVPLFITTNNERIARELSLSYGVYANLVDHNFKATTEFVVTSLEMLKTQAVVQDSDIIVIISGNPNRDTNKGTEFMEINTVEEAIKGHNR